jgi:hypothetical protein
MDDLNASLDRMKKITRIMNRISEMQKSSDRCNPEELREFGQILFAADTCVDRETKLQMVASFTSDIADAMKADKCDRPIECLEALADMIRLIDSKQH